MKPLKTFSGKIRLTVDPSTGELVSRPLTPAEAMTLKSKTRRHRESTTRAGALKTLKRHGILSDEFITELLNQPHPKRKKLS